MSEFFDKTLTCVDCNEDFIWTAGEQEFIYDLKEKGKLDEKMPDGSIKIGEVKHPRRCIECRKKKKAQREASI